MVVMELPVHPVQLMAPLVPVVVAEEAVVLLVMSP